MADQLAAGKKQSVERADLEADNFERPANFEVIRISSKKVLTINAVGIALAPWLKDSVGIDADAWKIVSSSSSGKHFVLKFNLLPIQNARLVHKAMGTIKNEDGSFRTFEAIAADHSTNKLLVARDENPKARTQRRMAACLKKTTMEKYPNLENVHYRRNPKLEKTTMYIGDTPLCTMAPNADTIVADFFLWDYEAISKFQLDKNIIIDNTLKLLDNPEESIQWRV